MFKSKKFRMAGTEKTGKYIVLACTSRGRVGVRVLDGNPDELDTITEARVRVEPGNGTKMLKSMATALSSNDWKQPGANGQHRFSIVTDGESLPHRLREGLAAIGADTLITANNPDLPGWAAALIS